MTSHNWKVHAPLLRTSTVILLSLCLISWAVIMFQQISPAEKNPNRSTWQWVAEPRFDASNSPIEGWQSYEEGSTIPSINYWIRIPIDSNHLTDPYLKIEGIGSLQVVVNHEMIYAYFLPDDSKWWTPGRNMKLVELPLPLPATIDVLVHYKSFEPITATVHIDNKSSLFLKQFHKDLDSIILGVLLMFSGLVTLGLYITQRDRLYIYFCLLVFSGGIPAIANIQLLTLIWNGSILSYFQNVFLPLGTFAFVGALKEVFPTILSRTNQWLKWISFAYTIFIFAASLKSVSFYSTTVNFYLSIFVLVMIAAFRTISVAYKQSKDNESIWLMAGFLSMMLISFMHMFRFILKNIFPEPIRSSFDWFDWIPTNFLYWGIFTFVVCLIRVIIYRYTAMNRQMLEFNRSLEQIVKDRTHELQLQTEQLQLTHERLAASMRDNTEALVETLIMEERHRVTGGIHDTVGHTLSAVVIQLEAAKRLINRDQVQAQAKLISAQDLVRQGLEDIRQSVRLLRADSGYYNLPAAIGALIRDTEQMYSCRFEQHIKELPSALSTWQKRVLFQTLQEAIKLDPANIPQSFRLSIGSDDDVVYMRLTYCGRSSLPNTSGVGLQTMNEHIEQLQGSLTITLGPIDSELTLTLPLKNSLSNSI
ncbi:MAG: histidine kinase [Candidatus Cohnella colombiensis]|uniref:histidine kinase n=1 Tax=Candidatus Cohnella colombiensis TaxID=3121368 RepID=A0AA95EWN3_9BACL|nr:MAG: histidine kinase [Cohnella sp.]